MRCERFKLARPVPVLQAPEVFELSENSAISSKPRRLLAHSGKKSATHAIPTWPDNRSLLACVEPSRLALALGVASLRYLSAFLASLGLNQVGRSGHAAAAQWRKPRGLAGRIVERFAVLNQHKTDSGTFFCMEATPTCGGLALGSGVYNCFYDSLGAVMVMSVEITADKRSMAASAWRSCLPGRQARQSQSQR